MVLITLSVDAPAGTAEGVKEAVACYLERFGDVKVISVTERLPEQLTFGRPYGDPGRR